MKQCKINAVGPGLRQCECALLKGLILTNVQVSIFGRKQNQEVGQRAFFSLIVSLAIAQQGPSVDINTQQLCPIQQSVLHAGTLVAVHRIRPTNNQTACVSSHRSLGYFS